MIMPDTQSFIIMYILPGNYSIVCIGFHPYPSKTSPSLSCQVPPPPTTLNLQTVQAPPPFLGNPLPLCCIFVSIPPSPT